MIYLQLFWEFFKTGLFAIGGGMATVPFLQNISAKTGWYTAGQLADMIAVSESTPGPIGVNMATYVGYTVGVQTGGPAMGVVSAVIATMGLVMPSIIIILIISYFLKKFREAKVVNNTLYGLRAASVALISAAGINIVLFALLNVPDIGHIGQASINPMCIALAALILVLTRYVKQTKKLHPIWFIVLSAVLGIVFKLG